ncbi:MAG: DinB family protein [Ktedonobacterales bacterium]|nr:DinB family protein [Ktedonobacterales bacterium]
MDTDLAAIRGILAITPARWRNLAENVADELLAQPPRAGEWSAVDCLRHAIATEREVFPMRVRQILAGEDFAAFDPDAAGAQAPANNAVELAASFAQMRVKSPELFDKLTPEQLSRTAQHPALGTVTLGELINDWAAHDLMRLVQAERSLMQPFIAALGPWRSYFTDHIA